MELTRQDYLDRNKAIALFLGYTYYPYKPEESQLQEMLTVPDRQPTGQFYQPVAFGWVKGDRARAKQPSKMTSGEHRVVGRVTADLKYDFEWSWLMPVVLVINRMPGYSVEIRHDCTIVWEQPNLTELSASGICVSHDQGEMMNTWLAVSDFAILWNQKHPRSIEN